jgi:dTDP-glucose 4,6-dehydratase
MQIDKRISNRARYLITGGAGFIGTNFILNWLEQRRDDVIINFDKLTYAGNINNFKQIANNPRYIFIHGDICNYNQINHVLSTYQPCAIINFAAESHVDRSILGPRKFVQTNIVGTAELLQSAYNYWQKLNTKNKESFRFLQISTDEVYGSLRPEEPAFTEKTPYSPSSPYSASKAAADHLVQAYYKTYKFPTLTTHCSNNYGPYQFPEKLIPLIIHNALQNKRLPIYGDGLQIRDWLYVKDHCTAILKVLEQGKIGETYNIGGCNEMTNLEVVNTICKILDELQPSTSQKHYSSLIDFVQDRKGHDRRYAIDSSKIQQTLEWTPKETFKTGIYKTIVWYLENQSSTSAVLTKNYSQWIEQNYTERSTK